jgi:hypothetical protein
MFCKIIRQIQKKVLLLQNVGKVLVVGNNFYYFEVMGLTLIGYIYNFLLKNCP